MARPKKINHNNVIKQKVVDGSVVRLEKCGAMYFVNIGEEQYYKGANELFAVQKFNEI